MEWVPVGVLLLIIGLAIGRLTHPSRSDVERYADDIARKGFAHGYKEGWKDSKIGGDAPVLARQRRAWVM